MGLILKEIVNKAEAMEKSIHEQKAEFVYCCIREKKNNSFEISIIILRYIRNVNLSYSTLILKLPNFLQKTSFFLYLTGRPKNGDGNKQRRCRKYMRKSN